MVMIPYLQIFNFILLVIMNIFIILAFQGLMTKVITGITMTHKYFLISIYYLSLELLMSYVFVMKRYSIFFALFIFNKTLQYFGIALCTSSSINEWKTLRLLFFNEPKLDLSLDDL